MRLDHYYGACAFLAGLAVTLVLASWLTPRQWWRRPTARNLFIAGVGTWAFGSLILHFASAPLPLMAQSGLPSAFAPLRSGQETAREANPPHLQAAAPVFRVHRDLNLRASASVEAPRLALVPAGASVTPTGVRSGDWWQVRTLADGKPSTGWVSSLWLRRTAE
jgi:hypothetical protein